VLFTHIKDDAAKLRTPAKIDDYCRERQPFFEGCLSCPNVSLVFIYVSFGIEFYVDAVQHGTSAIDFKVIEGEERVWNALHLAHDSAFRKLKKKESDEFPRFVFIGVRELACLLRGLHRRKPMLVENLAGSGFTYDSPKFVEAVIRLARGPGKNPVLRIDADVVPNEEAVDALLKRWEGFIAMGTQPYWWFSGHYKGIRRDKKDCPVNAFAVRQHWLLDPHSIDKPTEFELRPGAQYFVHDLGQLGATQFDPRLTQPDPASFCSPSCQEMLSTRRGGVTVARPSAQSISGAGLIASFNAIHRLPPFMNAGRMIVWIDDDLKRQLH
jgi:hypothetical protein